MAARRVIFQLPLAGLHKGFAHAAQPDMTTDDCLNVRAKSAVDNRVRLAQRAGVSKAYPAQPGGSNPIRCLGEVVVSNVPTTTPYNDADDFDRPNASDLGEGWETPAWATEAPDGSLVIKNNKADLRKHWFVANVWGQAGYDAMQDYSIQVDVDNPGGKGWDVVLHLYARMDTATPDIEDAGLDVALRLDKNAGQWDYSGSAIVTVAGTPTEHALSTGSLQYTDAPFVFRLEVSGNDIWVVLNGVYILGTSQGVGGQAITAAAGLAVGIGLDRRTYGSGDPASLDNFRLDGAVASAEAVPARSILLVGNNGNLYEEDAGGAIDTTALTADAASISTDHAIMSTPIGQKLILADYQPVRAAGSAGTIVGTLLDDDGTITDWTALGIDVDTDLVRLYSVAGPTAGLYRISSVHATNGITLASSPADGTCSFEVVRAPLVYENGATPDVDILFPTAGETPLGCTICTTYRGRLVMAGDLDAPFDWYMSRVFDPTDFNYDAVDALAATAGSEANSDAGQNEDIITALIPWSDDYLLFGGRHTLYRLSGDPLAGGSFDAVSRTVGVLDRFSWCNGPDGTVFFMAPDGLWAMSPAGQELTPLSQGRLPRDLYRINTATHEVQLGWEPEQNCIMVFVTTRETGTSTHYVFDLETKGFWTDQLPSTVGPVMLHEQAARLGQFQRLLLAGRDGYLRKFDVEARGDDGTAIAAYCYLTPLPIGFGPGTLGVLNSVQVVLDESADTVDWELRFGRTAQEAKNAFATHTGKWFAGGLQRAMRNRGRGAVALLKVGNSTLGETFAIETIIGVTREAGKVRL